MMNPYISIWTRTSETIDYLLVHGLNKKLLNLNFLIAGLTAALLNLSENNAFAVFGVLGGLIFLMFLTLFAWLLFKYILSYIYLLTGKIWNGKANFRQVVLIMSLAFIPEIIYLTYILILFIVSGEIVEVNYLIRLIGWIFTIRILVIGLAKVQEFKYGLALLNLFLPAIILMVLSLLVGVIRN
jgi:hypothetical protein